ncbi:MAG: hypothetical protein AMXMBFR83_02610 [Phycisphaerae bacterium]
MRDGEKQAAVARAIVRRRADLAADARAFDAAMRLLRLTRIIPAEERHPLTDRIRRAPRSVCSNAVEARRERCHPPPAFIGKPKDAEGEAAATQAGMQFAVAWAYLPRKAATEGYQEYNAIPGVLVDMIVRAGDWTLKRGNGSS